MSKRILVAAAFVAGMACGGLLRAGLGLTQTHDVSEAIAVAASRHNVSEQRMRCLAFRESTFQPWAYNRAGYHGLYQFSWQTWNWAAPRAGWPEASPYDPYAAADVAAWLGTQWHYGGWRHWPSARLCGL